MEFRVCSVPVAPMRREPSHRSEMMSQLLFGEKAVLAETISQGWVKVKCKYDDYEGWVQRDQILPIDEHKFKKPDNLLTADWINEIDFNGYSMHIPMGCSLSAFGNGLTPWNKNIVKFKGNTWNATEIIFSEKILKQTAYKYLNTPYLWGGKSVFGIDCSGFAQTIYKYFNKAIPRDSFQQAEQGETVNFLQEVKCGDLAFFDNEEGRIVHVGILLNANEIIHASSKVRIDKLDSEGIINRETKERTHHLRIIKRFFD